MLLDAGWTSAAIPSGGPAVRVGEEPPDGSVLVCKDFDVESSVVPLFRWIPNAVGRVIPPMQVGNRPLPDIGPVKACPVLLGNLQTGWQGKAMVGIGRPGTRFHKVTEGILLAR